MKSQVYVEQLAARLYAAWECAEDAPHELDDRDYMRCIEHLWGYRTVPDRLQPAIDLYVHMVETCED